MTFAEYELEAMQTKQLDADAIYVFTKMMIEAAEAAQPIVKQRYHGKPFDYLEVFDELGDVLWYLTASADAIGASLDDIAKHNIAKLRMRHGETYNPNFYQNGR